MIKNKKYSFRKKSFFKKSTYLARKKYIEDILPMKRTTALDLGCGDGSTLELMNYLGFKNIEGVDKKKINRKIFFPNIKFFNTDIEKFLSQENSRKYDLITMFDVLEHLKPNKVPNILKKCFYLLSEEGYLIIQIPNGASIFNGVYFYGDPTHIFTYNEYSLKDLLIRSGFDERNILFKETSPVLRNLKGVIRLILWKIIRFFIRSIHTIETGSSPKINTRTLICASQKNKI